MMTNVEDHFTINYCLVYDIVLVECTSADVFKIVTVHYLLQGSACKNSPSMYKHAKGTLSILIRTVLRVAVSGNIILVGIFAFVRNAEMPLNGAVTHIELITPHCQNLALQHKEHYHLLETWHPK